MLHRRLGKSGFSVSAIGFGCMGLSDGRAPASAGERRRAIARALDRGVTHFDTADFYGDGDNERLLGRELRAVRSRLVIATKGGLVRAARGVRVDGTPAHIRAACDASLRRLRFDCVDLYYLHRVDPAVPVEESVGAMADLVRQGKVRHLGLSKVDEATLARAETVHPIAALQRQYSVARREVESGVVAACRVQDVALVAYSPLGKGRLTRPAGAAADGWARAIEPLGREAARLGCTPAQLALAWLLARDACAIPIPGMRCRSHVDEALDALDISVPPATLAALAPAALEAPPVTA